MQILIWKAYGDIDVHCAETPAQLESILSDVIDCVKYVTSVEDIPTIRKYEDKIKVLIEYKNLEAAKRFILDIIDEFSLVGNHDSFQYFYFDKVKYV